MKEPTRHKGIVRLGKRRYAIRARATCPRTGKRKEVRREASCSLRGARVLQQQWREELEASLAAPTATSRIRLADFARSWLAGRIEAGSLKPSSAEKIASVFDLHIEPVLGSLYVDDISTADIENWLDGQRKKTYRPGKGKASARKAKARPYSNGAILGQYRVLRSIMERATGKLQLRNPCDGVDPDKIPVSDPPADNFLTADELHKVLSHVENTSPQWYPAVLLDAFTALRWGELSALRWEDIDSERGWIEVSRGNWKGRVIESLKTTRAGRRAKPKRVPLLPEIAEALDQHRQRMILAQHPGIARGWIFPTARGTLHKGSPLRKVLGAACAAASVGRRFTPHGFRHTANDLLRRHATGDVVRAITGHVTQSMTHHYSHVDEDEKLAAVARAFRVVRGGKGVTKGVVSGKEGTG